MQESKKTICFVATAAVLGIAALVNGFVNRPGGNASSVVGEAFYPDFTSTEAARSLEVSAVDPETGSLKRFAVENDGNLWRIPTHNNYPAEAAARIAETSASVMGLEKEALVGMRESEFEKFGVVDPLSDDLEDPETAGKRITLKDENGEPLVDYIIGKEIEESVPSRGETRFELGSDAKDFYIRRADDSQTFRVTLDIDLSTSFADWIDPDLLRISRADVSEVSINNYELKERGVGRFGMAGLSKSQGDQLKINRPSPAEPWTLEGLGATEEVNTDRINEILDVLDEIKMVGVRPKFKFEGKQLLNADLTLVEIPELKADPRKATIAYRSLQEDLSEKGFNFGGTQQNLELVSEHGELEFGTSKGLRYRLNVGSVVAEQEDTIEIGSEDEAEAGDKEPEDSGAGDDENRFLFVRVSFDESLLGDRPVAPTKPEEPVKPEGYTPAEAEKEAKPADAESKTDEDAEKEPANQERPEEFVAYEASLQVWETIKGQHEMNLTRFKQENEAFDKKIEAGKKLVDELNQRFGDWFYVIAASNLNTIQSTRKDVVNTKELPPGQTLPPVTPPADISFPGMGAAPTFKPEATDEPAAAAPEPMEKKEAEEKADDPATDPKEPEVKIEESKPDSEPATEPKKASDEAAAEPKAEEVAEPKAEEAPEKPAPPSEPAAEVEVESTEPAKPEPPVEEPAEPAKPEEPKS